MGAGSHLPLRRMCEATSVASQIESAKGAPNKMGARSRPCPHTYTRRARDGTRQAARLGERVASAPTHSFSRLLHEGEKGLKNQKMAAACLSSIYLIDGFAV